MSEMEDAAREYLQGVKEQYDKAGVEWSVGRGNELMLAFCAGWQLRPDAKAEPGLAPLPEGLEVGTRIEITDGWYIGRFGRIVGPGPWSADGATVEIELPASGANQPLAMMYYSARQLRPAMVAR